MTVEALRDGSGVVSVELVADKELVRRAANAIIEFETNTADAVGAGWTSTGVTDGADDSRTVVLTKTFATVGEATAILSELSGPDGPFHGLSLTQSRKFGDIRTGLTGEVGLARGIDGLSDTEITRLLNGQVPLPAARTAKLADQLAITLVTKFPGQPQTDTSITVPFDDVSRISVDLRSRDLDLRAQAARRNTWFAFGAAALVFLAFLILLWRRSERERWKRQR